MQKREMVKLTALGVVLLLSSVMAVAGVESSLLGLKDQLVKVILPLISVIGIALAGVSFFTGNPNAKQHIAFAIIGCIIGFASDSIVVLLKSIVS